jgi:MYXO-CTERM domain-containing protein
MIPKDSYNKTAEEETVHEHPGCGCVAAGLGGGSGSAAVVAALGATFIVGARRRRK